MIKLKRIKRSPTLGFKQNQKEREARRNPRKQTRLEGEKGKYPPKTFCETKLQNFDGLAREAPFDKLRPSKFSCVAIPVPPCETSLIDHRIIPEGSK